MKVKAVRCKLINRIRHTYIDHHRPPVTHLEGANIPFQKQNALLTMIKFKQTPINRQNVIRNSLTTANPV